MIQEAICGDEHLPVIKTWNKRIKDLGYSKARFARRINRKRENLSRWANLKNGITIRNFLRVENNLRKLEKREPLVI
jgi:hypothetical protein